MEYPIVYIEWLDSFGTWSWSDVEDAQKVGPSECKSVGFLVAEEDTHVTLVTSLGAEDSVNGTITIPKGCITKQTQAGGALTK